MSSTLAVFTTVAVMTAVTGYGNGIRCPPDEQFLSFNDLLGIVLSSFIAYLIVGTVSHPVLQLLVGLMAVGTYLAGKFVAILRRMDELKSE